MTVREKLLLLGKDGGRVKVGSKLQVDGDDGGESESDVDMEQEKTRRTPATVEPLLFHSIPYQGFQELLHGFDAVGCISLAGDGRLAEACLERRIPFWGLAWTPQHVAALTKRLEARAFELMCSPESKLYQPGLHALISEQEGMDPNVAGGDEEPPKGRGKSRGKGRGKANAKGRGRGQPSPDAGQPDAGPGMVESDDLLNQVREMANCAAE